MQITGWKLGALVSETECLMAHQVPLEFQVLDPTAHHAIIMLPAHWTQHPSWAQLHVGALDCAAGRLRVQIDWGVRVDELHQVSPSAAYIHPGIAKRLQDLWDEGSNLLSLLDDRCRSINTRCCWSRCC